MGTKVVGKLDNWSDADVGDRSTFIKIEEGSNEFRLVSSPYQTYVHWINDASGQLRKVQCAMKDCPACAAAKEDKEQAKPHWYVAAFSRKTNTVGILDLGPQIFRGIKDLTKKKAYGDPRTYDIDVTRNPKGTQPLYTVTPMPKEPLTDDEKAIIRTAMEKIDLTAMTAAPTPDDLREKLGFAKKASKPAAVVEDDDVVPSSDDDSDFNFDK